MLDKSEELALLWGVFLCAKKKIASLSSLLPIVIT